MNAIIAVKLKDKAQEVAELFSQARERNFASEIFSVEEIIPLSEYTAAVIFLKNTERKAIAFFYWLESSGQKGNYWQYFFPKDSHILGMEIFGEYKRRTELENLRTR